MTKLSELSIIVANLVTAVALADHPTVEEIRAGLPNTLTAGERKFAEFYCEGRWPILSVDHIGMKLDPIEPGLRKDTAVQSFEIGDVGEIRRDPENTISLDQVINNRTVLALGYKLWLEGIDASGLTDASNESLNTLGMVFEVVGTKQYATSTGSRTVKRLVVIDHTKIIGLVDELKAKQTPRTWKDTTGKFQVVARFVESKLQDGKSTVVLKKLDGTTIAVPQSKLSEGDQKWVRDELRYHQMAASSKGKSSGKKVKGSLSGK